MQPVCHVAEGMSATRTTLLSPVVCSFKCALSHTLVAGHRVFSPYVLQSSDTGSGGETKPFFDLLAKCPEAVALGRTLL